MKTLREVLELINSCGDWFEMPATSANQQGAYADYPLHKVAHWGDVEAARVLLDNGADIDAVGEDEETPLLRAILGRKTEMIKFLLSRGADLNPKDIYGKTALDAARVWGNQDIYLAILRKV